MIIDVFYDSDSIMTLPAWRGILSSAFGAADQRNDGNLEGEKGVFPKGKLL